MSQDNTSSRIKANERSVSYLRLGMATICIALARAIRPWTSSLLLRAFSTPFVRLKPTAPQQALLDEGESFTIRIQGAEAQAWRWGSGPAVLLVHGWAGRAAQLTAWVPELTRRGYSVIALDQPAHGEAPGTHTNATVMTNILLALSRQTGPLAGVVAHSLGGLVSSYAMSQGMQAGSMILLSTPTEPGPYFEDLMKMARLPTDRWREVKLGAESLLGATFEDFAIRNSWRGASTPALIFHDQKDRQVPFSTLSEHRESIPHATIHETQGLGHNRILQNAKVLEAGIDFIESHCLPSFQESLATDFASRMSAQNSNIEIRLELNEVMEDLGYGRC